jgi:cell division protein FtsL
VSALIFLFLAVVVCAVGCGVLWYQHRTPNTLDSGIQAFRREMDALAPPDEEAGPRDGPGSG